MKKVTVLLDTNEGTVELEIGNVEFDMENGSAIVRVHHPFDEPQEEEEEE